MNISGSLFLLLQYKVFLVVSFLFFIVPLWAVGAEFDYALFFSVLGFSLGVIFSINLRRPALLYYCSYFLFVFLGVYTIQTGVGIGFIDGKRLPTPTSWLAVAFVWIHLFGLFVGVYITRRFYRGAFFFAWYGPSRIKIWLLISIASIFILLAATLLGLDVFFGVRNEVRDDFTEIGGISRFLFFVAKIIFFVMILFVMQRFIVRNSNLISYLLLISLIFVALLIANPSNTARFISLAGVSLIVMHYLAARGMHKLINVLVIVSPLLLLVILPLTSILRHGLGSLGLEEIFSSLRKLEFSSFQYLIDSIDVSMQSDLGMMNFLSSVFIFVPRIIWPAKSDALFDIISPAKDYVINNVAITSSFYGYADFGFFGLFIVSVAMGGILGAVRFDRGANIMNRRYFYSLAVFCFVPVLARGSMGLFFIGFYATAISYEVLRVVAKIKYSSR